MCLQYSDKKCGRGHPPPSEVMMIIITDEEYWVWICMLQVNWAVELSTKFHGIFYNIWRSSFTLKIRSRNFTKWVSKHSESGWNWDITNEVNHWRTTDGLLRILWKLWISWQLYGTTTPPTTVAKQPSKEAAVIRVLRTTAIRQHLSGLGTWFQISVPSLSCLQLLWFIFRRHRHPPGRCSSCLSLPRIEIRFSVFNNNIFYSTQDNWIEKASFNYLFVDRSVQYRYIMSRSSSTWRLTISTQNKIGAGGVSADGWVMVATPCYCSQ